MKNSEAEEKLALFDALVMAYHKKYPRAESPLNFVEWLGVPAMLDILQKAKELGAEVKIVLDFSNPFQPTLKDVQYITRKKVSKLLPSDGLTMQNVA